MKKRVVILGATGSVGLSALDVVRALPDRFDVVGLSTHRRGDRLRLLVEEFHPRVVVLGTDAARTSFGPAGPEIWEGEEGLLRLAGLPDADIVVNAVVGAAGLRPTLAALDAGQTLALANKESLVLAGDIVMERAARCGAEIRPVDSELNALAQCLSGCRSSEVARVVLTASGGPFRDLDREALERMTAGEALRHPVWDMGPRITVDSATLMNKGFEILETHWLFGFPLDRIDVLVHPQSAVHAIVEFVDGVSIPLLSAADMRLPLQHALTAPERIPTRVPRLDLAALGTLTFEPPDAERFPCLRLAQEAARRGGTAPAVLNAADEEAVRAFLDGRIRFTDIPRVVGMCLDAHRPVDGPDIDEILNADAWARAASKEDVEAMSRPA